MTPRQLFTVALVVALAAPPRTLWSADAGRIQFENRQKNSGVSFVLDNGTLPEKPMIDGIPGGVALLDYDNDGYLDIFFTNGATLPGLAKASDKFSNCLYHNNHDGTFTDVTDRAGLRGEGYSVGAAAADYDNDGRTDLYVTGFDRNFLYHNNGDGTFTDVSKVMGIARHIGKGMGVAIADYNDDGWMDIFVANDNDRNFLFKNRGGKAFDEVGVESFVAYTDSGLPVSSMGVDFRDWNNDGKPSLIVTALGGETYPLFRNEGNGFFSYESYKAGIGFRSFKMSGWGAGIQDFDNDGYKDLFTANSHVSENADLDSQQHYRQANAVFRNMHDGTFQDVSGDAGPGMQIRAAHRGCAFGDLNNDGKIDVVVSAIGSPAELLYNTSTGGNHWILIKTVGVKSNRDGIGTRIKVTTASGLLQYNHVTTAGSYASSNDPRVHFGLGADGAIKEIELKWPSGTVQVLHNLKSGQILIVSEE